MINNIKIYYIPLVKKICSIAPISSILTIFGQFFNGIFPAVITIITAQLVELVGEHINGVDNRIDIIIVQGILVFAYLIQQVIQFIMSITINAGVFEKCNSEFKIEIAQKASKIALINYEDTNILNMYTRARDCINREIPSSIFLAFVTVLMNFISVITVMVVLASYSVWFIPVSIVSVIPFYVVKKIRGDEFYKLKFKQTKDNRELNYLWGLFTHKDSIREMRVMCFENYIIDKWIAKRDEIDEEVWKHNMKETKSMITCDVIRVIGYMISIVFAIIFLVQGLITIGPFAACLSAFTSVQNTTKEFFIKLSNIRNNGTFLKDYFDFIGVEEEKEVVNINTCNEVEDIVLNNVTFSYPGTNRIAIRDINLSIKRGEKIAIVGQNGSGKTTLCKIILGIYQPQKGKVSQSDRVSGNCGIVSQNYVKYKMTLRENIGISDIKNIENRNKIMELIEYMDISELIKENENIDYRLGTEFGGEDLSGGQWQKIAISRAIYNKANMYILDEPTSALDPLIELDVMNSFLKIAEDRTTVMVLHRMGLCKSVDRIIVMKDGEILETGSHTELMKKRGEYYHMFNEQSKWY